MKHEYIEMLLKIVKLQKYIDTETEKYIKSEEYQIKNNILEVATQKESLKIILINKLYQDNFMAYIDEIINFVDYQINEIKKIDQKSIVEKKSLKI